MGGLGGCTLGGACLGATCATSRDGGALVLSCSSIERRTSAERLRGIPVGLEVLGSSFIGEMLRSDEKSNIFGSWLAFSAGSCAPFFSSFIVAHYTGMRKFAEIHTIDKKAADESAAAVSGQVISSNYSD